MGKAAKHKKGKKYYFAETGSRTIRTIYAESDDEAYEKIKELLGHENFTVGQLPHGQSKEETRRLEKLSEDLAGELMGPFAKHIMKTMHELDRECR